MKNFVLSVTLIAILFSFLFSCSDNKPSSPQPTATPTSVATIAPLYVDDFEDNNYVNVFNTNWLASANGGSSFLHGCFIYSGDNKNGAYAMVLSATVEAAINAGAFYYGTSYITTGIVANATPVNISVYSKMKFSAAIDGYATGSAYPYFYVYMNDGSSITAWKEISNTFDPVFKEYVLDLSSFNVSGGALNDLYTNLKQIIFYVDVRSLTQSDTADVQFYIDDIRFTQWMKNNIRYNCMDAYAIGKMIWLS